MWPFGKRKKQQEKPCPRQTAYYSAARSRPTPVDPGYIIDENGVERKVLGSLPLTADGCVVGNGAQLWDIHNQRDGEKLGLCLWVLSECDDWSVEPSDVAGSLARRYSTQEAAKLAASARTSGGKEGA